METKELIKFYPPEEERINIISHAAGLLLSVVCLVFLVTSSIASGDSLYIISFSIFGISMVLLYAASTLYHSAKKAELRKKYKVLDHASIYLLIAGTYTPFTLITLKGSTGWALFGIVWGFALAGIILKLFFTGKYSLVSTFMYVLMGWVILFAIQPLFNNLSSSGLFWLFVGGMSYTVGAILYSIKKLKFNHAIFHVFVLGGSACHFIAVYYFV